MYPAFIITLGGQTRLTKGASPHWDALCRIAPLGLPPPSPARSIPGAHEASAPPTPAPHSQYSLPATPARSSMDGASDLRGQATPQQQPAGAVSSPAEPCLISLHAWQALEPCLQ